MILLLRSVRRTCALVALVLLSQHLIAAEPEKKTFNVPAGEAETTLREFTKQANVQLVFDSEKVAGVKTAAVQGESTPRAALEQMFASTELLVEQDATSGVFTVRPRTRTESKNVPSRLESDRAADSPLRAGTGVVTGRISNEATRAYLENVEVRLAGSARSVATDREGRFVLPDVPAGLQTVVATYAGPDATQTEVNVRAGETTISNLTMSSAVYTLGEFVVSADREGRAEAITSQRRAPNLKKIVASDEFGNLSEGNVGEVLRNMAGIDMEFSGTDPQTIKVRGIDAALTGFTVDGNNYANAASSGSNRKFELEAMAVQNVEKVEVSFAPTPAQDGTAIGGAVNLVSRSPFSYRGRRLSAVFSGTITSLHTELGKIYFPDGHGEHFSMQPGGSLLYSETFGKENNFGVLFTFSSSHKMSFTDQANKTWNYPATVTPGVALEDPNYTYLRSFNGGIGGNDLRRRGASLNFAYKVGTHTTITFNNQWNDFYNLLRGNTLTFNINGGSIATGSNENRTVATPTTSTNTNVQLVGTGFNK